MAEIKFLLLLLFFLLTNPNPFCIQKGYKNYVGFFIVTKNCLL